MHRSLSPFMHLVIQFYFYIYLFVLFLRQTVTQCVLRVLSGCLLLVSHLTLLLHTQFSYNWNAILILLIFPLLYHKICEDYNKFKSGDCSVIRRDIMSSINLKQLFFSAQYKELCLTNILISVQLMFPCSVVTKTIYTKSLVVLCLFIYLFLSTKQTFFSTILYKKHVLIVCKL